MELPQTARETLIVPRHFLEPQRQATLGEVFENL